MTPAHVEALISSGHEVVVEPASKRAFSDVEFENAGAKLSTDLNDCDLILGVKQIPIESLVADSTSVFFSHTIKAQPDNMPLLDECLRKNVRLVDYECIATDLQDRILFETESCGSNMTA